MTEEKPKNLTIAATGDNVGKTSITLGITSYFADELSRIGFIKPLSWNTITQGGRSLDRDTLLINKTVPVNCHIDDMSPVALKGGFPEEYTREEARSAKRNQIREAYERVAEGKDLVVVEGSGNAAAGESIGLSTAHMGGMVDARAVIISGGEVGHPIDEVLLNKQYFEDKGVEVIGAIFNKVDPEDMKKVNTVARRVLADHDVPLLGVIPYQEGLYEPDIMQIVEKLNCQVLHGEENLNRRAGRIGLGAMTPQNAMNYFKEPFFIVTSGDRQDLIFAALSAHLVSQEDPERDFELRGLMLTGGLMPDDNIMELIRRTRIPVLMVEDDSYEAVRRLNNMKVSIDHNDRQKLDHIKNMVQEEVDLSELQELLGL